MIDKRWHDSLHLASATGIVHRDTESRFDATRSVRPYTPIVYVAEERSRLLSLETRLS